MDLYDINDENEEEGTGSDGKAEEVGFRYKDAYSLDPRDDQLSPQEMKRLLAVHKDVHKSRVDKQKILRQDRKSQKEGPTSIVERTEYKGDYSGPGGGGTSSNYKTHPIAAKFSGIHDPKVTVMPSENIAETNDELRNELDNKLENKLENKNEYRQKYTPKPRPF